jgi:hypothetical protein
VLSAINGVTMLEEDGQRAAFDYLSEPTAAAELLATLIASGLLVASFAPLQAGLEAAYLRTGIRQVD